MDGFSLPAVDCNCVVYPVANVTERNVSCYAFKTYLQKEEKESYSSGKVVDVLMQSHAQMPSYIPPISK